VEVDFPAVVGCSAGLHGPRNYESHYLETRISTAQQCCPSKSGVVRLIEGVDLDSIAGYHFCRCRLTSLFEGGWALGRAQHMKISKHEYPLFSVSLSMKVKKNLPSLLFPPRVNETFR
jgi:hypothetical protein